MAVITVTRMPGAQGDLVAHGVAQRLGYRLVGRNDLVHLATALGGPEAWDRAPELRERSPSLWERLNEERRRYSSVLRSVVIRLAEEDNVVIVGLGAGQLLRGLGHVLRVLVVAPAAFRAAQLEQTGSDDHPGPLEPERARELLKQLDREAAGYIRYLFNIEWLEPQHWDLVLNTARIRVPHAIDLLAAAVEGGVVQPTAEDRQRVANLALASRVEAALLNQANVWVSALRVWAEDGRVRLEGEVIAEEDREVAEEVVRHVPGVQQVDNDLRIQPPPLTGM